MGNENSSQNPQSEIFKNQKNVEKKQKKNQILTIEDLQISFSSLVSEKKGQIQQYYKMEDTIGTGSFGKVIKAIHKETNQIRAVKVINRERNHIDTLEKILQEVNVLKNLDHPNILKIYECFQDKNNYYIVSEYCQGGELFETISKKLALSEKEASQITAQLISAISYMHNKGFIHRDIKPENILFLFDTQNSPIKLIDFGSSIKKQNNIAYRTGTCYYIAPEILQRNYNQQCDLWSIGVVTYIMLSGYPPFNDQDEQQIFEKILNCDYNFKENIWENISQDAKNFISNMLKLDPKQRYTPEQALQDPWIKKFNTNLVSNIQENQLQQSFQNLVNFNYNYKLQKILLLFLMDNFTSNNEKIQLLQIFKVLDVNQDGVLDKDDIQYALNQIKFLNQKDQNRILKMVNNSKNGCINYTDFLLRSVNKTNLLSSQNLKQAFQILDVKKKGYLTINEIKTLFQGSPDDIHQNVWEKIINQVDTNNDGKIQFNEFEAFMKEFQRKDSQIQFNDMIEQKQDINLLYNIEQNPILERQFGKIYKCTQKNDKKQLAIYQIYKRLFLYENIQQIKKYLIELKIKKNQKEETIQIYDIFSDSKCYYLVTDFYFQGDLTDYLRTQINFTEQKLALLTQQILQNLSISHSQNLFHCKLSPYSIFFQSLIKQSKPKIFYEIFSQEPTMQINTQFDIYKAPEFYQNNQLSAENDMFSLGVMLYLIVTGKKPFENQEKLIKNEEINLETIEFALYSQNFKKFLKNLLIKNPQKRFNVNQALNDEWIKQMINFKQKLPNLDKTLNKYQIFQQKQEFVVQIQLFLIYDSLLDENLQEISNFLQKLDPDGQKTVNYNEFINGLKDKLDQIEYRQEIQNIQLLMQEQQQNKIQNQNYSTQNSNSNRTSLENQNTLSESQVTQKINQSYEKTENNIENTQNIENIQLQQQSQINQFQYQNWFQNFAEFSKINISQALTIKFQLYNINEPDPNFLKIETAKDLINQLDPAQLKIIDQFFSQRESISLEEFKFLLQQIKKTFKEKLLQNKIRTNSFRRQSNSHKNNQNNINNNSVIQLQPIKQKETRKSLKELKQFLINNANQQKNELNNDDLNMDSTQKEQNLIQQENFQNNENISEDSIQSESSSDYDQANENDAENSDEDQDLQKLSKKNDEKKQFYSPGRSPSILMKYKLQTIEEEEDQMNISYNQRKKL